MQTLTPEHAFLNPKLWCTSSSQPEGVPHHQLVAEDCLSKHMMSKGAEALHSVRAVILDEAHERTVRLDILLALLFEMQRKRQDLEAS